MFLQTIINEFLLSIGFTGTQCEIDIDECSTAPCLNGGTCHDHINSFKCSCPIGFTGVRCQTNVDDCDSQPCRNGGICHDAIAGYSCECPPGYTGKLKNVYLGRVFLTRFVLPRVVM
jgi:EGF-like domain